MKQNPDQTADGSQSDEATNSPLADHVYGEILSQILSGSLEVGAKLPSENDYCRIFSVSRPIVQVALARLGAGGIVERKRGSGTFLKRRPSKRLADFAKPGDLNVLLQCLEYRIEIEGTAARTGYAVRTHVTANPCARVCARAHGVRERVCACARAGARVCTSVRGVAVWRVRTEWRMAPFAQGRLPRALATP